MQNRVLLLAQRLRIVVAVLAFCLVEANVGNAQTPQVANDQPVTIGSMLRDDTADATLDPQVQPASCQLSDFSSDRHHDVACGYTQFTHCGQASAGPLNWLQLDNDRSYYLLDFQNRQADKELVLLDWARSLSGSGPAFIVGGQARLSLLGAVSNETDKFPYLGRFPTDFSGDSATDARILHANMQLSAAINSWAVVYGELLFSDVFTFESFNQGSLQTRQAYALFHYDDAYVYIGKKNVGFGDFGTLSPFTQTVVWHYFAGLAEGIGIGYDGEDTKLTVAALNGGRGIRVVDSVERGKLNNFAANATKFFRVTDERWIRIGAGFLYGTIYDGFTAEHIDQNQFGTDYNSAWDVNGRINWDRFSIAGEFVSTLDPWPVTDAKVSAYVVEAAYEPDTEQPCRFSISWGEGFQGPEGSEFEFNQQLVIGMGRRLGPHAFGSLEYVRSSGFAPLINITTVSDRSVVQDSLVAGLNLHF